MRFAGNGTGGTHVPRLTGRSAELGIVSLGLALVLLGVFDFATNGRTAVAFGLATVPAATALAIWGGVRRLEYEGSLYPRLFLWTLGGAAGLVGIVVFSLLVEGGSFVDAIPLVQFLGGSGQPVD